MMKSDDTYQLPPELAVAFETGRVEFVSLLSKQVANGRELPQQQIVDLLRLIEHMIIDKQTTKQRMTEVEHVLRFVDDAAKGLYKKSAEARAILRGTPMPDDAEE